MTSRNNLLSHAKCFHFKGQTHIEHLCADMNIPSARDSLLFAKVSKLPHHPMQILVKRVRVFGKASWIKFNEFLLRRFLVSFTDRLVYSVMQIELICTENR